MHEKISSTICSDHSVNTLWLNNQTLVTSCSWPCLVESITQPHLMIIDTNLLWSPCILNIDLDIFFLFNFWHHLDVIVITQFQFLLRNLVGNGGVTHIFSDMTIISWDNFLGRFRNPLLPHFLSDVIYFFFLLIFNSTYIHAILARWPSSVQV